MRLRASPRNVFWLITLWSGVILFGVVDKLLNGEVRANFLSEQSGLRHLLNFGNLRHLMLENASSNLLEEDMRSYIPVRFYPSYPYSSCLFNFFSMMIFMCRLIGHFLTWGAGKMTITVYQSSTSLEEISPRYHWKAHIFLLPTYGRIHLQGVSSSSGPGFSWLFFLLFHCLLCCSGYDYP